MHTHVNVCERVSVFQKTKKKIYTEIFFYLSLYICPSARTKPRIILVRAIKTTAKTRVEKYRNYYFLLFFFVLNI